MIKIAGHIVLIGVVLVCLYHSVTAQNLQIDITHSSIENGLSQTSVNCLFQDAHGFLWVGTQDGLNKYDGYSFEVFRNQPRKANTLSDNLIHSICEDNNGNIWIATHSGLNKYDVTSGSFKPYTTDVHVGAILAEHNCQYVYEDRNHFIWIKIEGHLYKLNPTTGKVKTYALPDETADFNNRYSITQDWLGFIWIATSNGLMVLNDKQEFEIYDTKSNKTKNISNNEIRVIYETSKSHLFIGTSYGLNYFNRSNLNFETYYFQGTHSDNVVNAICEDENDVLWVGTQNGIKFFSKSQNKFLDNYYISNYTNNVVEGEISSIIRDKSGVFWVGSQNGLYKINTQKRKFNLYRKTSDVLTGTNIAGNNITALMVMDNLIWVGTRFDGLTLLERKTGNAINHTVQGQNTISDNYISTFFKTKKGDILIGTGNGLNYCKPAPPNTMKYTIYPFPYKGNYFSKNRINAITEQTHDIYWIATNRGLFTVKNQTVTLFENRGFTSEEVYDLLFDKDSLLWLGCNNGLFSYDIKTEEIQHYDSLLSGNTVFDLLLDKDSTLWIGTESGLDLFDKTNNTVTFYTEESSLSNHFIHAILQDNKHNIWVSTNRGISKIARNNNSIVNYDKHDGLQGFEYNMGAKYKTADGELFFGGKNGFNSFFPDSLPPLATHLDVAITAFEKNNESKRYKRYLHNDQEIELSYTDFGIKIEFSTFDFAFTQKNNYWYKLENFETDWNYVNQGHSALYPKIPPGTYIFKVKASNDIKPSDGNATSIRIVVRPPIWQSVPAYIFYISSLLVLFYIFVLAITRNLRKARKEIKEKEIVALKIAKQSDELSVKNKNITDSITYAKRIIEALLPSEKTFMKVLPDSFILYLPKDIVSGDFYWINERDDKVFLAVVDCTGHGVPGALMSIIGFELLRNIIDEQGVEKPAEVLSKLNDGLTLKFGNNREDNVRDGMDLALCVIDRSNKILEYAGAYNPLYLIRDNKIVEYPADRCSIGMKEEEFEHFTNHAIELLEDDMIYLFTDGYADQFGGPDGKKFKYRRFRRLLLMINKQAMSKQRESLEKSVKSWKQDLEQVDDILVIGLKPISALNNRHV